MKSKVKLAVVLAALMATPAGADLLTDLGFLPGGSLELLSPALIVNDGDPIPPGAEKAPLYDSDAYTCSGGASATTGPTYGFVVLNTSGLDNTKVTAEVSVKNGIPNTTYDIYLNQDPGDCPTTPSGTIKTNGQGNGNGHVEEIRVPGATNFWASAFDPTHYPQPKSILRSPAVHLD